MKVFTLTTSQIAAYFGPRQRQDGVWIERGGVSALPSLRTELGSVLESILQTARQFVPAEAGSILLESIDAEHKSLVFAACYGERGEDLIGREVPGDRGVVGWVFSEGVPYLSGSLPEDPHFYADIDHHLGFATENLLCVPIFLDGVVCGVLELLNRIGGAFEARDLNLLTVFAGYISSSIQNALDARFAHELAKRDELSGLYNDRYFHQISYELVRDALARDELLSIIFFDLDNLKKVNDHHGHLAGAAILREVGGLVAELLPDTAIAARYGGDEYIVLWPGATLAQGQALAEDLLERIRANVYLAIPHWLDAPVLHLKDMISASLGVAELRALGLNTFPDPRTAKNHLIRAADAAMYSAKTNGKGRVVLASSSEAEA